MLEKDVMLVATRFIQQNGMDHPENMPPESYKKLVEVVDANKKSYEMAVSPPNPLSYQTSLNAVTRSKPA